MVKHTQTIRRQIAWVCLSVFHNFVILALKGLRKLNNDARDLVREKWKNEKWLTQWKWTREMVVDDVELHFKFYNACFNVCLRENLWNHPKCVKLDGSVNDFTW